MKHENKTLSGTVNLDGEEFVNCTFDRATLVYVGGEPPTLKDCNFAAFTFEFQGSAARTVLFLQAMASPNSGLQRVIRETFPALGAN